MEKLPVNSKEIKKYILNVENDLEGLIEYLEEDYQNTTVGIFNALFTLMRHYEQNKSRVQYLIYLIESTLSVKQSKELKGLSGQIIDLDNKVSQLKLKDRIAIREPLNQIHEIFLAINRNAGVVPNEKIKYLSFQIFQEKNIPLIESFLKENQGILSSRNKEGENIFDILLKQYLYLDEKNVEEIAYYYHIILLFLNSSCRKEIIHNKEKYLDFIKKSKLECREHIIRLIELFDPNYQVTLDKIEKRYHVNFDFFSSVLEEMNTFKMDNTNRINFLHQECITIDGESTTCLDDAFYLEKNLDGTYTLYVHITDIPSFVPYQSIVDMEAKKRAETLYLKDRKISLYPEEISDGICSLIPNNHRNVISYIFHLDSNFSLIEDDFSFVKGKIQVKHRLTYQSADQIIFGEENTSLAVMLKRLVLFAEVRKKGNIIRDIYREYQNAIDFDPNHESFKTSVSPSANIVHESMVLTNYQIGKYFKDSSLPYLYRKIDLPSESFIQEQLLKLKNLDSSFLKNKEYYQKIKDSYTKAQYTDKPVYHKGQNLECYSHSSSPARRYADAFNQYLLYDFIFQNEQSNQSIYKWEYQLHDLAYYLNQKKKENEVFSSHYNYLASKSLIKKK